MSSGELPRSAPMSMTVAASAFGSNRRLQSCGNTESNSAASPGANRRADHRNRRRCCERAAESGSRKLHPFPDRNTATACARVAARHYALLAADFIGSLYVTFGFVAGTFDYVKYHHLWYR